MCALVTGVQTCALPIWIFESCREQNWENLINSVVRSFAAANCDVRQPISEDDPGGQWQRIYIAGHGSVGIPARCDPRLLPPWQTHRQRVHRRLPHQAAVLMPVVHKHRLQSTARSEERSVGKEFVST